MNNSVWIFGYGSLIWNPGFEYQESEKGYVPDFARKFWQGNTMHRGNEEMPGRVVTIVEEKNQNVSGVAFRVEGMEQISAAFKHLYYREIENGYQYEMVKVNLENGRQIQAITVIARSDNEYYLGPQTPEKMAYEIANATGMAGPNSEYLLKLAYWNKKLFPNFHDQHLYELESLVVFMIDVAA